MKTKLTLTLDEEIIKKGKTYAAKQHISLSNLLERFLKKELENNERSFVDKWDPIFSKIRGKSEEDLTTIRYKHIKSKHT
jgi:hypothetical protein